MIKNQDQDYRDKVLKMVSEHGVSVKKSRPDIVYSTIEVMLCEETAFFPANRFSHSEIIKAKHRLLTETDGKYSITISAVKNANKETVGWNVKPICQ